MGFWWFILGLWRGGKVFRLFCRGGVRGEERDFIRLCFRLFKWKMEKIIVIFFLFL